MEPPSLFPARAGFTKHEPDPAQAGFRARAEAPPTILVLDAGWRRLIPGAERLAARAAAAAGGAGTVVLSSDRAVKSLNALHRRRNKPTNVLTFEMAPAGFLGGDIVLALGTVRREAEAAGRSASAHLAHLVVHGALHLRGHDHHHVGDARRMEMEEMRILRRIGFANPWRHR